MKCFFVAALAALAVSACSTAPPKVPEGGSYSKTIRPDKSVVEEYRSSYAVQAEDLKDARAQQKPIFELEALDGQTIELRGVKRLAVYQPGGGAGQAGSLLTAPTREPSAFEKTVAVFDRGLSLAMQGLGLYYNYKGVVVNAQANRDVQLGAQRMTVDVANSVGSSNSAIAGMIQAPGASTSYTLDGSFMTMGNNSPLTHSSNNPVTRTCTGGQGAAAGAGSTSTTGAGAPGGAGGAGGGATC
jgi:hypothetical protein